MQKYCALQERAPYDVELKLRKFGLDYVQRTQIIADLIEHDFLNETRFALAYASGKFKMNKWGKVKIKQGLYQKYVSAYNIKQALSSISQAVYQNQLEGLLQKYTASHKLNLHAWQDQQKVLRYATQKGYEPELIRACIRQM